MMTVHRRRLVSLLPSAIVQTSHNLPISAMKDDKKRTFLICNHQDGFRDGIWA
jgi:hypothetical protein